MAVLNPVTKQQFRRFCSVKRGVWSLAVLLGLLFVSFFAEVFINSRLLWSVIRESFIFPPTRI